MKEYFSENELRRIEIEALGRSAWCKGALGGIMWFHGAIYDDEICPICGQFADYLCDAPMIDNEGNTKRCDMPLCVDHACIIGDDLHVCPAHKARDGYSQYVFINEEPGDGYADNRFI